MASNRELRERAAQLSEKLGLESQTVGLGNAELSALVAELEAKQPAPPVVEAGKLPVAAVVTAPSPALTTGPRRPAVPFYVAPGKALSINSGIVGPLTPVKASDFQRGQVDLDHCVSRGLVIKT